MRNVSLAIWAVFLAAAFLLPEDWLYRPAMDLLDRLLWPLVAAWGKPAAVALVAFGLAALTMIGQRLLTDNARLLVAKGRAAELRRLAAKESAGSPGRAAMLRLAGPVQWRIVGASLVPLAVVLGPMVLTFLWFPERVDPASWNARPGATAYVIATVDGEFTRPIALAADPALRLDGSTPEAQSLPPVRAALEARLAEWQRSSDLSGLPWEAREAARLIGNDLREDLRDYLSADLPPQTLAWTLYAPADEGRFPISLTADDETAVETALVVGDACPPERREDLGDGKGPVQVVRPSDPTSPVQWVKVVYSEPQGRRVFWAPLARLGRSDWDAGWLLTYILAYVPAMLLLRRALRLP